MAKIVYNACYGGFGLSDEAVLRYAEIKGITLYPFKDQFFTHFYLCSREEYELLWREDEESDVTCDRFARSDAMYFSARDIKRNDPALAQVVEELGEKANGMCARLRIIEIESGTLYRIDEYDGSESVVTRDDDEWSVA